MQINTDCCNSRQRQIEELAVENNELKTKLQAEEERRRILSEKSQVKGFKGVLASAVHVLFDMFPK